MTDETEEAPINPALAETPAENIAPGSMRERLTIALAVHAAALDEATQIKLAEAVSKPSPVEMMVNVFAAMTTAPEGGAAPSESCGPVLLSRVIECADLIFAHSWFGKGDEAAAFAATARASLAPSP